MHLSILDIVKHWYFTFIILLIPCINIGQLDYDWAFSLAESEENFLIDLEFSTNGDVYILGTYKGNIDMNPSSQNYILTIMGNLDTYLAKYTSTGALIWAKSIGGSGAVILPFDIELDDYNNIYIAGSIEGTADFDPNSGTTNLSSTASFGSNSFIAKYDTSGNLNWANTFPGDDNYSSVIKIKDSSLYIGGLINGYVTFTSAGGGYSYSQSNGGYYYSKFDINGQLIWVKSLNTYGNFFRTLAIDSNDNIILGGSFFANIDMDPGVGTVEMNTSGGSGFVGKYDSLGNYIWSLQLSTAGSSAVNHLVLDQNSNIFITGRDTSQSIMIGCINSNGMIQWLHKLGSANMHSGLEIDISNNDNLFCSGVITNSSSNLVDFDHTSSIMTTALANGTNESIDAWVGEFSKINGDVLWVDAIGGSISNTVGFETSTAKLHPDGSIYIGGGFTDEIFLNPGGIPIFSTINQGSKNTFISHFTYTPVSIQTKDPIVISIYPNPSDDIIYIDSKLTIQNYTVIDIYGNLIATGFNQKINVSHFASGIYILIIESNKGLFQTKFIKE